MKHHHSHAALFTLAFSATLVVFGLYGYMRHSVNVSLSKALSARETVRREELYKRQGQDLMVTFETTAAGRARLASFFIEDNKTIDFIETIESLGARTGSTIVLSSIEADDLGASQPGTTGSIRAHVDVHGSWQSVMKTIMLAETLPYKVSINRVQVDTSGTPDAKGGSPEWRGSFTIAALMVRHRE